MTDKAELDEFKILKAQIDKQQGIQPRWSKSKNKQMRKRSEINLEKYNQIVVPDENKVEHEFESEYRGRVQNRAVDNTYKPMYCLSFAKYDNGVRSYQAFSADVERYNASKESANSVYVNCKMTQLDSQESNDFFSRIDMLSARIDAAKSVADVKNIVLERAVCYSVIQNYDAAVADLTVYASIDSTSSLGYWQRAYCISRQNAYNASQGVDVQLTTAKAMSDINQAIEVSPKNQYLFYNRGNMYVAAKDYAKAIADYTVAISIDANLAEAYYNRGLALIDSGEKQAGLMDLSKAGELGLYDAYSLMKKHQSEGKNAKP